MKPLVSVLTPCYNEEKHIGNYIEKMLNQTYDNVELVIVNDGSTDNTEKIIQKYKQRIEKRGFKLTYKNQKNRGVGGAIQQALKIMNGEFFCWCDSDNYYDDTYIEKNIKIFMNNNEVNIVRCDGLLFYENNLKEPYHQFSKFNNDKFCKKLFLNAILEENFHFGCAMIKTSAFDKVCKNKEIYESRKGQNWQILLPMFYYYDSYYIDENLFFYINRNGSITNQCDSKEKMIELQNEHERILLETIKRMGIKDSKYYERIIKRKYILRRISIAETYNDNDMLKKQKKNLKKFDNIFNRLKYFVLFPKYKKVK